MVLLKTDLTQNTQKIFLISWFHLQVTDLTKVTLQPTLLLHTKQLILKQIIQQNLSQPTLQTKLPVLINFLFTLQKVVAWDLKSTHQISTVLTKYLMLLMVVSFTDCLELKTSVKVPQTKSFENDKKMDHSKVIWNFWTVLIYAL